MNLRLPLCLTLAAFTLTGCGQKETASAPAASAPAPAAAAPAAAPAAAAPRVIEITANDTMRFSVVTIDAKAGETIKIVLTNIGTMPKEAISSVVGLGGFVAYFTGGFVNGFTGLILQKTGSYVWIFAYFSTMYLLSLLVLQLLVPRIQQEEKRA